MGLFGYDGDAESSDDLARMEIEAEAEMWAAADIDVWTQEANDFEAELDFYDD